MTDTHYKILRDDTTGYLLFDSNLGLFISDLTMPITFIHGLFPPEYLTVRNPDGAREYTTTETVDGVVTTDFWGSIRFEGNPAIFKEEVILTMRKTVFDGFLQWFNTGGCAQTFIWPRLTDGTPLVGNFFGGALRDANPVPDGTGRWMEVRFTLQLREPNDDDILGE